MKRDSVFLQHILEAITQIETYTAGISVAQFRKERLIQDGVVRQLEIIGEASRNLSDKIRNRHPEVPWRQIIGMRNRIIHAYFDLNLTIVWEVVQNDLPQLKQNIEQIVDE